MLIAKNCTSNTIVSDFENRICENAVDMKQDDQVDNADGDRASYQEEDGNMNDIRMLVKTVLSDLLNNQSVSDCSEQTGSFNIEQTKIIDKFIADLESLIQRVGFYY